MTPRSLFNIILKVIGIFCIKDLFSFLPQFIYGLSYATMGNTSFSLIITPLFVMFVYASFAWFLLFKTNIIINKLKLDNGFDQENILLNFSRSVVLTIALIVIGALLIADALPRFCQHLYTYIVDSNLGSTTSSKTDFNYLIESGVRLAVGLLFIAEQRKIVNLIERKNGGQLLSSTDSTLQIHTFKKEPRGWFIDLPEYIAQGGTKEALQMVEGADTMLDIISNGESSVTLAMDTKPFPGADRLVLIEACDPGIGGGIYLLPDFEGKHVSHRMWLCEVVLFVFGGLPEEIYVKRQ